MPFGPWPGSPTGAKFLVDIYNNGLVDPQTDNLFAMPSGNLRFLGNSGSGGVPGVAFYESATTLGDQRFATWYTRRYMRVGIGVGQTIGDALVGYDPLWDGISFGPLNGIKLTTSLAGFTNVDDQTSASMAVTLGEASFQAASGFFDGPVCFPTPGFNSGSVEVFVLDLWNGADTAIESAFSFNGWGQIISRPIALANGVTAGLDMRPAWAHTTTAAGDGIGIMWRRGDDDPPCAMVNDYMLTSSAFGDYGLAFYARSGGTLSKIASFDWTNGIQLNAPLSTLGTQLAQVFKATIDLTSTGTVTQVVPAVVGKQFVPTFLSYVGFVNSAVAGAVTTAPNITVGDNATFDNFITATQGTGQPTTTLFGDGVGGMTRVLGGTNIDGTPGNAVSVKVQNGATGTGGFVWQVTIIITGFYV